MTDDPIDVLDRWEVSGGVWRVLGRHGSEVTVGLFRCDGGELVDVLRSADEAFVAFLGGRRSSLD